MADPNGDTEGWAADASEDMVRDLTGVTLGDFAIKKLLGRGGMGQVYLATQTSLNRDVAIKVLHPRFLSKPIYLSRFEAEATAVARLNHANIVHVYVIDNINDVRFIAMEYVEGTNLRDYLIRKGALDLSLAFSIMRQAGLAIGYAGEHGLVHRDIKPENLLLTKKGRVKVADFGLCRDTESDRLHVTQPGTTMGTPLYMSPEQAQGKPLDHRSDLYSLGVTFYHLLTGEPPFRADSAVAMAMKHVNETPLSPRVLRPEIPEALEQLVLKLMAKKPIDRYQTAAEMLSDLAKIRAAYQPASSLGADGLGATPSTAATSQGTARSGSMPSLISVVKATASSLPSLEGKPLRARSLVLASLACLVIGAGVGWYTIPEPPRVASSARMPGLDLEPEWASIAKQPSAAEQYRFAQLAASEEEIGPAMAAVPGHHPAAGEWTTPAYLQLGRQLYRRRDVERLERFKRELEQWKGKKSADSDLIQVLEPAIARLRNDPTAVIEQFARISAREEPTILDPGLIELSAEVVADTLSLLSSTDSTSRAAQRERLVGIQTRLMSYLRRVRMSEWTGR